MAIVHRGMNQARQEISLYVQQYVYEEETAHKERVRKRPAQVRVGIFVISICLAVILCLLFVPGLLKGILNAVEDMFNDWGDALMNGGLLSILFGLVVYLVGLISPLLMIVILFGLPLLILAISALDISFFDPNFDYAGVRNRALELLPNDLSMKAYGADVEEKAVDVLSGILNDQCHIFTNVIVPYDGDYSETDCIVLTPKNITLIEIKGHKGIISGDISGKNLYQTKGRDQETFYNPVKQCATHVYRLGNYLRSFGSAVTVRRCVWFFSAEATLQLSDMTNTAKECPIFHGMDSSLYQYLISGSGTPLSEKTKNSIISLLDDLISHPPVRNT